LKVLLFATSARSSRAGQSRPPLAASRTTLESYASDIMMALASQQMQPPSRRSVAFLFALARR
jgi:hypothetical protein